MSGKKKTLCQWKKEKFKERFDKLKTIVKEPRYACQKCGRVAKDEQWLCKPVSLSE